MDKLKELLGEELFNQVKEKIGDKKIQIDDDNFVPLTEVKSLRKENKDLKQQLKDKDEAISKRDDDLEEIKGKLEDNEELKKQIEDLQEENEKKDKEYKSKLENLKFDRDLERTLKEEFKAKNYKAVKALLDTDSIKKDGETFLGLKDQVEKLQESDGYLFGDDSLRGRDNGPNKDVNNGPIKSENPWIMGQINLQEQARLIKENPKQAKLYIEQADKEPSNWGLK